MLRRSFRIYSVLLFLYVCILRCESREPSIPSAATPPSPPSKSASSSSSSSSPSSSLPVGVQRPASTAREEGRNDHDEKLAPPNKVRVVATADTHSIHSTSASDLFKDIDDDNDGFLEMDEIEGFIRDEVGGHAFDSDEEIELGMMEVIGNVLEDEGGFNEGEEGSPEGETEEGDLVGNSIDARQLTDYWMDLGHVLNVDAVAEWVKYSCLLPDCSKKFKAAAISGYDFPLLVEDDGQALLTDLHIQSALKRKQLLRSIQMKVLGIGDPPSPVPILTATEADCDSLTLAWKKSPKTPIRVHLYRLQQREYTEKKAERLTRVWTTVYAGNERIYTATNLKPGQQYEFRVTAWNLIGRSKSTHAQATTKLECTTNSKIHTDTQTHASTNIDGGTAADATLLSPSPDAAILTPSHSSHTRANTDTHASPLLPQHHSHSSSTGTATITANNNNNNNNNNKRETQHITNTNILAQTVPVFTRDDETTEHRGNRYAPGAHQSRDKYYASQPSPTLSPPSSLLAVLGAGFSTLLSVVGGTVSAFQFMMTLASIAALCYYGYVVAQGRGNDNSAGYIEGVLTGSRHGQHVTPMTRSSISVSGRSVSPLHAHAHANALARDFPLDDGVLGVHPALLQRQYSEKRNKLSGLVRSHSSDGFFDEEEFKKGNLSRSDRSVSGMTGMRARGWGSTAMDLNICCVCMKKFGWKKDKVGYRFKHICHLCHQAFCHKHGRSAHARFKPCGVPGDCICSNCLEKKGERWRR